MCLRIMMRKCRFSVIALLDLRVSSYVCIIGQYSRSAVIQSVWCDGLYHDLHCCIPSMHWLREYTANYHRQVTVAGHRRIPPPLLNGILCDCRVYQAVLYTMHYGTPSVAGTTHGGERGTSIICNRRWTQWCPGCTGPPPTCSKGKVLSSMTL